ncbi:MULTISPECIES: class I SAM-dependent methyltransferase [Cyanophyceae]|uniref:Class I SAM-dependent methyltransferase n=1 Tax=Leptolyngbya subtilissima DQ-A4 TaxID=2933933 RepID=A0ABV0K0J9_9CYAN|nr:class I SAM-dependent methyltransferase [Nodosilinea sp. FACHB-141]MBD2112088.1 class I SAM-dependent methyltransferase [Nodosilinea sp. FACHB-141]
MPPNVLPLHTLNPLGRFSDRAQDYARYRPGYPPEAIAAILADMGDPRSLVVADIGAGTGISSRLLGDRGPQIIAVEPNAAMREAAEAHPQVVFQPGTGEQTELADKSVHIVTCCQSFHWFNAPLALAEFSRILQMGGRLALLWNDWDLKDSGTAAYYQIIHAVATRAIDHRDHTQALKAVEQQTEFSRVRHLSFAYGQTLTLPEVVGRSLSSSYIPKEGRAHLQFLDASAAWHGAWAAIDGTVTLKYVTNLYLSEKVAT